MASCVCGNSSPTEQCCGRFIHGGGHANTAEELMRSRYAAYVLGAIDYIVQTNNPHRDEPFDAEAAAEWSGTAQWEGLKIIDTEAGGLNDELGFVEFVASYGQQGRSYALKERSRFQKFDGRWFYMDGDTETFEGAKRSNKVGRNDPCPCGSKKKYKKCCGKPK